MSRSEVVIVVDGHITNRDAARMVVFLQKMTGLLLAPQITAHPDSAEVRWTAEMGGVVTSAQGFFPMLLGAWMSVNRNIEPADVDSVEVRRIS